LGERLELRALCHALDLSLKDVIAFADAVSKPT
jgi:hypothetical protein